VNEAVTAVALPRATSRARPRLQRTRAAAVLAFLLTNGVAIVWLWVHGGNLDVHTTGEWLTSFARLTGLLAAYLALIQVLLLARLPALERAIGLDRLSVWHRWNGHVCIDLVVAHVLLSVWGYAALDKLGFFGELTTMIGGGIYPGMVTATIGTAALLAVVVTSVVIVKRRLRYEWWYAVHLLAYAGIALAWFHQIPTGNELVLDEAAADYWRALYVATPAVLVVYRVLAPAAAALRHRLRVIAVRAEGPGVVSLELAGRSLDQLRAQPGQFFLWRFLSPGRWWKAHPFSLSAAPAPNRLRITIKDLGDFTSTAGSIPVGTRVLAEGPFGTFTSAKARRPKSLLIAGGIGITPIRALLEELRGDVVVVYRVVSEDEAIFLDELAPLAPTLHLVAGDHRDGANAHLMSGGHLAELVPDLAEREVFVCGPPPSPTSPAATSSGPASRAGASTPNASPSEKGDPNAQDRSRSTQCPVAGAAGHERGRRGDRLERQAEGRRHHAPVRRQRGRGRPLGPAPGRDHRPQDDHHGRREGDRAAADRRDQRPHVSRPH
jgi:predicted ferric reductase